MAPQEIAIVTVIARGRLHAAIILFGIIIKHRELAMTTLANVFAHPLLSPASVELVMFLLALATLVSPRIPQSRSTKRDGFAFLANPQVQALVAVHENDNLPWRTKINRMHLFGEAPSFTGNLYWCAVIVAKNIAGEIYPTGSQRKNRRWLYAHGY